MLCKMKKSFPADFGRMKNLKKSTIFWPEFKHSIINTVVLAIAPKFAFRE